MNIKEVRNVLRAFLKEVSKEDKAINEWLIENTILADGKEGGFTIRDGAIAPHWLIIVGRYGNATIILDNTCGTWIDIANNVDINYEILEMNYAYFPECEIRHYDDLDEFIEAHKGGENE